MVGESRVSTVYAIALSRFLLSDHDIGQTRARPRVHARMHRLVPFTLKRAPRLEPAITTAAACQWSPSARNEDIEAVLAVDYGWLLASTSSYV